MDQFELSKSVLLKIINDDIPFSIALKNTFRKQNSDPTIRSNVDALVGCELRHQYMFDNLIGRFLEEVDFEKTIYLRFALANKLFLRRFNTNELIALAKQDLPADKVDALLNYIDSTNEIIPSSLDKASPEFLSLRYNTPAWVIRMWQKQYGKGVVFKTLKANYRKSVPSIRVNTREVNIDEFVAKHPDFSKSPIEDMMIYQGRGSTKNVEEFKQNKIFYMRMATKYVLDELDLDPIKGIAIYTEFPNNIYLDLVTRFGKDVPLDLIINHQNYYHDTRKFILEKGYSRIHTYDSLYTGLLTCLSKKVHTLICMPKSTTFDALRSTPDYFLRIKQEQLDEVIATELATLEECSDFVEVGGELVYMINTLSRKESNSLIANFLVKHRDYELVEERQFFPFEVYDSCLYFARLKKVEAPSD